MGRPPGAIMVSARPGSLAVAAAGWIGQPLQPRDAGGGCRNSLARLGNRVTGWLASRPGTRRQGAPGSGLVTLFVMGVT